MNPWAHYNQAVTNLQRAKSRRRVSYWFGQIYRYSKLAALRQIPRDLHLLPWRKQL